jgi:hypothetical protein
MDPAHLNKLLCAKLPPTKRHCNFFLSTLLTPSWPSLTNHGKQSRQGRAGQGRINLGNFIQHLVTSKGEECSVLVTCNPLILKHVCIVSFTQNRNKEASLWVSWVTPPALGPNLFHSWQAHQHLSARMDMPDNRLWVG